MVYTKLKCHPTKRVSLLLIFWVPHWHKHDLFYSQRTYTLNMFQRSTEHATSLNFQYAHTSMFGHTYTQKEDHFRNINSKKWWLVGCGPIFRARSSLWSKSSPSTVNGPSGPGIFTIRCYVFILRITIYNVGFAHFCTMTRIIQST